MSSSQVRVRICEVNNMKCDAPGCGYTDTTSDFSDPCAWLNRPCPKCGASLLTPEDLATVLHLQADAKWQDAVYGPMPDGTIRLQAHMNGSGEIVALSAIEAENDKSFDTANGIE